MSKIVCYRCGYRSEDSDEFTVIGPHRLQWETMEPIILCNGCADELEKIRERVRNC